MTLKPHTEQASDTAIQLSYPASNPRAILINNQKLFNQAIQISHPTSNPAKSVSP